MLHFQLVLTAILSLVLIRSVDATIAIPSTFQPLQSMAEEAMEISLHPGAYRFVFQSSMNGMIHNRMIKWALKNGEVGVITTDEQGKRYLVPLDSKEWTQVSTVPTTPSVLASIPKRERLYPDEDENFAVKADLETFEYFDNVVKVMTTSTLYMDKENFAELLCIVTTWKWAQASVRGYERQATL